MRRCAEIALLRGPAHPYVTFAHRVRFPVKTNFILQAKRTVSHGLSNGFEVSNVHGGRPEATGGRLEAIRGHFSVIYCVSLRHNLGFKSGLWWLLKVL